MIRPSQARQHVAPLLGLAGLLGLLAWLFRATGDELTDRWSVDPNFSHGYFVPVVSLFFAVRIWKRRQLQIPQFVHPTDVRRGLTLCALALASHLVARVLGHLFMDVASLVLLLNGLLLTAGGDDVQKKLKFATLFLLFMAPVPSAWYRPVALMMQHLVSGTSAVLLQTAQVPAYREGYLVHLPGCTMEVGQACSGLRQLVAFLAISTAVAHLSERRNLYKIALVTSALPIAMLGNIFRVTLTGFVLILAGPRWAEGVFHTLQGLATMGIVTALLLGFAWLLGRLDDGTWHTSMPVKYVGSLSA